MSNQDSELPEMLSMSQEIDMDDEPVVSDETEPVAEEAEPAEGEEEGSGEEPVAEKTAEPEKPAAPVDGLTEGERRVLGSWLTPAEIDALTPGATRKLLAGLDGLIESIRARQEPAKPEEKPQPKAPPTKDEVLKDLGIEPGSLDEKLEETLYRQQLKIHQQEQTFNERLGKLEQSTQVVGKTLADQRREHEIEAFDSALNGLGDDWKEVFGSDWQDAAKSGRDQNRRDALATYDTMRQRFPRMEIKDLAMRAAMATFPDKIKSVQEPAGKKAAQATVRGRPVSGTNGKKWSPQEARQASIAEARRILQRASTRNDD